MKRVNPPPPLGYNETHSCDQFRAEFTEPLYMKALDFTGTTRTSWGGPPLGVVKQAIGGRLSDYQGSTSTFRIRNPEIFGEGFLRIAMVFRIDHYGEFDNSTAKYLEYDVYQRVTAIYESCQFQVVRLGDVGQEWTDYQVNWYDDMLAEFAHCGLDPTAWQLTYIAPTIEMINAGASLEIEDFAVWVGEPDEPDDEEPEEPEEPSDPWRDLMTLFKAVGFTVILIALKEE